jgi:hypothetical protein
MRLRLASLALALLAALPAQAQTQPRTPFEFIAIGDMPYKLPDDYARFDNVIRAINAAKPAFTLHMGDIKSGSSPCSDENFKKVFDQFQTFEGPVVYTIGDNEWTDCHRKDAGAFDPRERLAKVREIFFAKPEMSLGARPMPVESQGRTMPAFATYVENTRFSHHGVVFVGLHVPGSNNGLEAIDPLASATEYAARNKANLAWLNLSFTKAKEADASALVLFMQADFDESRLPNGEMPRQSGFVDTIKAIEDGTKAFGKPVLLIHGDEHFFSVGPLKNNKGKPIPNVTNMMVMGETELHGVKVSVDPASPGVFGFTPMIVPENLSK